MPEEARAFDTPSENEMARLRRAKEEVQARLFRIPGVHSIGIGYKRRGGQFTDELSVIVYVDHKLPRREMRPEWLIPREIQFFEAADQETVVLTDVVERPRAVEYPHLANGSLTGRVRPVPGGRSIQGGLGGGTLGGWVWDDLNDQVVLLSNNHVLGGAAGTDVYQPWGSTAPADKIADNVRTGSMDATVAAPTDSAHVSYEIEGVGPAVYETTTAVLNMPVEKSGATTEHTTGRVVAVNLTKAHMGSTNDFEVDPDAGQPRFAYFGDSGSLIVERTHPDGANWKRVVGLLWGGDPPLGNAYGHQIQDVFTDLDLTTVCSGLIAQVFDSMFARSFTATEFVREAELAREEIAREMVAGGPLMRELVRPELRPAPRAPSRWGRLITVARHRGIARDVETRIGQTQRGHKLTGMIQTHRVDLARLVADRRTRRVIEAAAAPFVEGMWSADEVVERQVTDEDVTRFNRALSAVAESRPELTELVEESRALLDELPGKSLGDVLR